MAELISNRRYAKQIVKPVCLSIKYAVANQKNMLNF